MNQIDTFFLCTIRKFIVIVPILFLNNFYVLGQQSIGALGIAVTENFNSLDASSTSSVLPTGWYLSETGSNANTTYSVGTGSNNSGDTYSFGSASSTDRALGGLRSGSLNPTFGAAFLNNTGSTVNCISITYTGEQWRLGDNTGRLDRLDFKFSTNATSLISGTWTDVDALDFSSPVTLGTIGALDGNSSSNRTTISYTISSLNLSTGSSIWIRWNDVDATNSDDGLSVDDFSITFLTLTPTVSNTNLIALDYNLGAGPSAYQSFNVSSTSLTGFPGNITLTAPANFEISLSPDGPYSSTVDIPYTSPSLASTPVYVQLSAGLSAGAYNGNITISGGGGTCTPTINVNGTVVPACTSTVSITSFTPSSGTAGSLLTINGSGFTGATSVGIGAANATTFTVIDDNTITATVPTNATSGKIVVNVGSCNGISGTDFSMTYTSNSDIVIRTQFVNPCGPDANNEFIVANTLTATVNIANLGLTSSNGSDINWYWGGKNLPSNPYPAFSSGASETCGSSGLGCFRFLDPGTIDSVSINAVINNLNSIAGCNVFRAVPSDGNIPPTSNVIFILGAAGCGLNSPASYMNFSNHCSAGSPLTQYFVVVGNGNTGCGAGGYFSNSSSRASTIFNYQGGGNTIGLNYQSQTSAYTKPPSVSDNTTQAAVFVPDGKGGSKWVNNNGCIPLPSIILSELKFDFYILRKQEGLDLQWNFKAGEPIKEFVIERSTDMETFKQIISIPINQYNHAELELHYKDVQVQTGVQYYRVKAISQKGTIYFSSICRTMDNQISAAVRIYPNPVTNFLYVNYQTRGIFSYEIINTSGITLQRGTLTGQTKKIETNELKSGIYFIRFMDDSGLLLHAEKLYKQ